MTAINSRCKCNCGYVCGGPGICKDSECWLKKDGNHYVRDCEHDFSGELKDEGNGCWSLRCAKCDMSATSHDMRFGA